MSSTTLPLSFGVGPDCSWLELLARAALGIERVEKVEVEVVAPHISKSALPLYLVVQTRAKHSSSKQRPLGSVQRAVTLEELRSGVRLPLVELGGSEVSEFHLVAWIEVGRPLELEGRHACPPTDRPVAMGRALRGASPVRLVVE